MAFAITLTKGRTDDYSMALYAANGTTKITLSATDVVRFKIYKRDGDTPALDLDSVAATANGSIVTVTQTASAAMATVRVHQDDSSGLIAGVYSAEICVVDDSDSDVIKSAEHGVVYVRSAAGGDVGLS